jgi:uncharacterized protein involved in exopolysaccharide biosynthesis
LTVPRQRSPDTASVPITRDPVITAPPAERAGITLVDIFSILLRYRVMIVVVALLMAFKTGVDVIRLPRYYSTDADFMPQGGGGAQQSQLGAIARQFGINTGGNTGDTPQFYIDLLTSRAVLMEVAKKDYELKTDSGVIRGNLIKLFGGEKMLPNYQRVFIVEKMKKLIAGKASPKTGVITLTVRAQTGDLAVQIANNLLSQINTFNLNRRQQQAGAERAFVEKRQAEALGELREAEGNLQAFQMQNRDFARSPTLQLEYNRLMRTVDMRQTVYTSLAAAYEQAKIEEVRDLPVITVLAPPEVPLIPESKKGVRKVAFALIVGLFLGIMLAFARAGLAASTRGHPNDVAEFDRLKKESLGDLSHPWRPVVRLFSRRKRERAAA